MELKEVRVLYDIRKSRGEMSCVPVIEISGYKFTGEPIRYNVAKKLCNQLLNPGIEVREIIGKFEFEVIEP
jgi:hypothetical protein